jgi:hypothetical protein
VTGGEVHADIEGLPEQDIDARYIRLVLFSFLILVGRFATLDGMKVKSVTPMHHVMSMESPAPAGGGLAGGGRSDVEQGVRP